MIRKSNKTKMKGFTLVELLAVIVILAIILVIAVPKVMDIITDAKKATLESTAKMIASQAEKSKIQNAILGKEDAITCDSVAQLSKSDYEDCDIDFDENTAKVTIKGKGKFNNLYVCNGTKTESTATEEECGLTCNEEEAYVQNVNVTKPYVVKDYEVCINYLEPIMLSEHKGYSEAELISTCKNAIKEGYSFEGLIYNLIDYEHFTEEELISNNIVSSDSVWESNITVGDYDSCVSYINNVFAGGAEEAEVMTLCAGNGGSFSRDIEIIMAIFQLTESDLLENNVIGSDSVFTNIKPGSSCVSKLKNIVVEEWEYTEEELQTLCSGKDINVVTYMDDLVMSGTVSERDLIENDVIEGSIEEEKVCVPNYSDAAVTYINNLYNDTNVRNKFGLIKDNTTKQNIRYAGKYVQNYVEFGNTEELWRIIGTFEVKTADGDTEKLLKIVRDAVLDTPMSWDSSAVNNGYGINEWSQADLKNMLNTYYLGESTSCTYCDWSSQATCTNSCNNSITPINGTYTSMIESVVWNTGAIEWTEDGMTPLQLYNAERGTRTGKICSSSDTDCNDSITRKTEWEGKIGLIYLSDFGYAGACTSIEEDSCKQNNWIHNGVMNWTISPAASSYGANSVWKIGGYAGYGTASSRDAVRPALYLNSNVQIIDGDGSKNNPYKLSLN